MAILFGMTLGEKIRNRRKELGLSQPKLAAATGLMQSQISELENKDGAETKGSRLTFDQLKALSKALSYSVDFLIDDEQIEPPPAPLGPMEFQVWELVRRLGPEEALDRLVLKPEVKRSDRRTEPGSEDKPAKS